MADPRVLSTEISGVLEQVPQVAKTQYDTTALYSPQYTDLNNALLRRSVTGSGGLLSLYGQAGPQVDQLNAQSASYQRGQDIQDVNRYGISAMNAVRQANPELYGGISTLENGVMRDLAYGGQLSPWEQAQAQQAARAGSSARGMLRGGESVASEALSLDSARQQREAARRNAALQVIQLRQQTALDPYQLVLGRPSNNVLNTQSTLAQGGSSVSAGNDTFTQLLGYGSDLYNTNLNAQASGEAADKNASAAKSAAKTSATGAIVGSVVGAGATLGGAYIMGSVIAF